MKNILVFTISLLTSLVAGGCANQTLIGEAGNDEVIIWRENVLRTEDLSKKETPISLSRSYTFFLFPSKDWLNGTSKKEVQDLYDAYLGFGDKITDDNLAIWLWQNERKLEPNTDLASDFIYKLKHKYGRKVSVNGGPYIVFFRLTSPQSTTRLTEWHRNGVKVRTMPFNDMINLISVGSKAVEEIFVMDVQQCGITGTKKVLHAMEVQIRNGGTGNFSDAEETYQNCRISILAEDVGQTMPKLRPYLEALEKAYPKLDIVFNIGNLF
jgi:hypothetical protein